VCGQQFIGCLPLLTRTTMGREGEWSAPGQYPQGTQPTGYASQNMQSYPGAPGGQYAQGMQPMQPGMRGPPPSGPPPSQYGNAAPSSGPPPSQYGNAAPTTRPPGPPGPPYGTPPSAARPQWAGPAGGPMARSSPGSGPPGPPPNAGPPGQSPLANRSYGGPPAGAPPQMRPQAPPPTNPSANAPRGMTGPPPGQSSMTKSS
jgi:hypothetical protein